VLLKNLTHKLDFFQISLAMGDGCQLAEQLFYFRKKMFEKILN
jgi:hypothetical protein